MTEEITGYRALNEVTVQGINAVKEAEGRLNWTLDMIRGADFVDPRLVAIAATQFELGFMALVKALANPERIVISPDEEIRAAEQRGYDAARPLDPDKIMIGDDA